MLLHNEISYANDIATWIDIVTEATWLSPELVALNMVSLGLLTIVTSKDKVDKKMKLFEMLNRTLQIENAPGKLQRHIWVLIQLAMVINKLDKIAYVSADYVVMPRSLANDLQNTIESILNPVLYALELVFSIALVILGAIQNNILLSILIMALLDPILIYLAIRVMRYQEVLSKIKVVLGSKDENESD
jgi:hypothetical protein